jgi:hypothetical protein
MRGGSLAAVWTAVVLFAGVLVAQDPVPSTVTLVNPGAEPTYRLVYKFTPGQFAHYEVSNSMRIVTQYGGANSVATNESQAWKQYRVVTVDEQGQATLEPIITRVKMSAQFDNLDAVKYDSQDPAPPPKDFAEIAKSVGQAVARVLFTSNGELLKISPLPGAPEKLAAAAPKADPQANFLVSLPKEAVGVGAVWKDRYQVPVTLGAGKLTQPITLQRQYTLTQVSGSIATITSKTTILTPLNDPQVEAQLIQRTPTGTIEFDLDRGLLVSHHTTVDKTVVNAFGPNSQLQASSETREKLTQGVAGVQPAALRQ